MSAVPPASRDPWLDNVKMVLVTLVVVGHAIGLVEATAGSHWVYDFIYLWHIPAIAVATFTLHALGFDAYDVDAPYFWAMLALRAVVFAVVMFAMFVLLSPLEHRPLPWWDAPVAATGARSTPCASRMAQTEPSVARS